MENVVLGKQLDGLEGVRAALDVAGTTESVVVVNVGGEGQVLGETFVAVLTLERLVQGSLFTGSKMNKIENKKPTLLHEHSETNLLV